MYLDTSLVPNGFWVATVLASLENGLVPSSKAAYTMGTNAKSF